MRAEIDAVRVAGTPDGPVPVVLLSIEGESDVLPIFVGVDEARSIAHGIDAIDIGRPMTHDLTLDIIEELGGRIDRVVVSELRESTYIADLHLNTPREDVVVDARPSDSLAMVARTNAPVEVSEIVFEDLPKDDPKVRQPNIEKARRILDWQPTVERRVQDLGDRQQAVAVGEHDHGALVFAARGREIARLSGRCQVQGLPALWCVVHGRVMSMLSRQDHSLRPGQRQRIQASAAEGGLPYLLQGHAGGDTIVQEARELCAPEHARATAGIVDAWLVECAHLDAPTCAALTRHYRALADGDGAAAAAIRELTSSYADDGLFPGHLAIGSRALDAVRGDRAKTI